MGFGLLSNLTDTANVAESYAVEEEGLREYWEAWGF